MFRTASTIATLLLGSLGTQAMAQVYAPTPAYPPPLANPPPQGYTPQRLIPADADGEQLYDAQGRPLPPGTVFRQAPPGYREVAPSYRGRNKLPKAMSRPCLRLPPNRRPRGRRCR